MPRPKNVRIARAAKAARILDAVSKKHNIDIKSLRRSDVRFQHFVIARREFCVRASAAGIGARIIADTLWCAPKTVQYHIAPKVREYRSHYYRSRRAT